MFYNIKKVVLFLKLVTRYYYFEIMGTFVPQSLPVFLFTFGPRFAQMKQKIFFIKGWRLLYSH